MAKNITDLLSGTISIYMLLIIIRIVMTWFSTQYANDPRNFLAKVCDPYLNYFRKLNLRLGQVDFSPIVAITVLVIASNILNMIGSYGRITVGIILGVILSSVWHAFSSLLTFFIIFIFIRLIMLLVSTNTFSPFASGLDSILVPLASKAAALFVKNAATGYQTNLMILCAEMIAVKLAGSFIMKYIIEYLPKLPF